MAEERPCRSGNTLRVTLAASFLLLVLASGAGDWNNMKRVSRAKWCALLFGAAGYLLAVSYYSTAPLTWNFGRSLLWNMCLSCVSITGLHSGTLRLALFVLGPINAAIYGAVGFLAARLVLAFKGSPKSPPPSAKVRPPRFCWAALLTLS